MILLSVKARRLLDSAVSQLSDPADRRVWQGWVRRHPEVREPDGPENDASGPMPPEVANVATTALSKMATSLRQQIRSPSIDEDEALQLDNSLAFIRSVEEVINRNAD